MLVTFECKAYSNITYFGDVAKQLLLMMGHSGTIPGAILAEDVPIALSRLKKTLSTYQNQQSPAKENSDDTNEKPVEIATRALPLIELLNAASTAQCDVMWR